MKFTILFSKSVKQDLRDLRAYDWRIVLDAIETQLSDAPTLETRKRKLLRNLSPPFDAVPPIWQLRVKQFRVFYDVDESWYRVHVRAVREKPAHTHTEEIL